MGTHSSLGRRTSSQQKGAPFEDHGEYGNDALRTHSTPKFRDHGGRTASRGNPIVEPTSPKLQKTTSQEWSEAPSLKPAEKTPETPARSKTKVHFGITNLAKTAVKKMMVGSLDKLSTSKARHTSRSATSAETSGTPSFSPLKTPLTPLTSDTTSTAAAVRPSNTANPLNSQIASETVPLPEHAITQSDDRRPINRTTETIEWRRSSLISMTSDTTRGCHVSTHSVEMAPSRTANTDNELCGDSAETLLAIPDVALCQNSLSTEDLQHHNHIPSGKTDIDDSEAPAKPFAEVEMQLESASETKDSALGRTTTWAAQESVEVKLDVFERSNTGGSSQEIPSLPRKAAGTSLPEVDRNTAPKDRSKVRISWKDNPRDRKASISHDLRDSFEKHSVKEEKRAEREAPLHRSAGLDKAGPSSPRKGTKTVKQNNAEVDIQRDQDKISSKNAGVISSKDSSELSPSAKDSSSFTTEKGPPIQLQKIPRTPLDLKTPPRLTRFRIYRNMENHFSDLEQIGQGTFGTVFKARIKATGQVVALKQIVDKKAKNNIFTLPNVREFKFFMKYKHRNILECLGIVSYVRHNPAVAPELCEYMVLEYMDHDLAGLMQHYPDKSLYRLEHLKCIAKQMFEGLQYMHERGVLHRDLKVGNLLLNNDGILKIADFGFARERDINEECGYTNRVCTVWYRPLEVLLGQLHYSTEIDIWGAGCIVAEMFLKYPIFHTPRGRDTEQIKRIMSVCGYPSDEEWDFFRRMDHSWSKLWLRPRWKYPRRLESYIREKAQIPVTDNFVELIVQMLNYDPSKRPTAKQVLESNWFMEEPKACEPWELPKIDGTWHEYECKERTKQKQQNKGKRDIDFLQMTAKNGNGDPISTITQQLGVAELPVQEQHQEDTQQNSEYQPIWNEERQAYYHPETKQFYVDRISAWVSIEEFDAKYYVPRSAGGSDSQGRGHRDKNGPSHGDYETPRKYDRYLNPQGSAGFDRPGQYSQASRGRDQRYGASDSNYAEWSGRPGQRNHREEWGRTDYLNSRENERPPLRSASTREEIPPKFGDQGHPSKSSATGDSWRSSGMHEAQLSPSAGRSGERDSSSLPAETLLPRGKRRKDSPISKRDIEMIKTGRPSDQTEVWYEEKGPESGSARKSPINEKGWTQRVRNDAPARGSADDIIGEESEINVKGSRAFKTPTKLDIPRSSSASRRSSLGSNPEIREQQDRRDPYPPADDGKGRSSVRKSWSQDNGRSRDSSRRLSDRDSGLYRSRSRSRSRESLHRRSERQSYHARRRSSRSTSPTTRSSDRRRSDLSRDARNRSPSSERGRKLRLRERRESVSSTASGLSRTSERDRPREQDMNSAMDSTCDKGAANVGNTMDVFAGLKDGGSRAKVAEKRKRSDADDDEQSRQEANLQHSPKKPRTETVELSFECLSPPDDAENRARPRLNLRPSTTSLACVYDTVYIRPNGPSYNAS